MSSERGSNAFSRKDFFRYAGLAGGAAVAGVGLSGVPAAAATGSAADTRPTLGGLTSRAPAPAAVPAAVPTPAAGWSILDGPSFPIGLFWPPPPLQTTVERYQEIVDAGFTFVLTGNYADDTQILGYLLGVADQVGLQVLVASDPNITWMTHEFTVSDDDGEFTLTSAEATAVLQQAINRYAGKTFWSVVDGQLMVSGGGGTGLGLSRLGSNWTNYTLAADITPLQTFEHGKYTQTGWAFRAQDTQNAYAWLLSNYPYTATKNSGYLAKVLYVNGKPAYVKPVPLPFAVTGGTTYHVETTVAGSRITTAINGRVVDTTTDSTYLSGRVGFRSDGDSSARIDNVTVTAPGGKVLLSDDFSNGLGQWIPQSTGHQSFAGFDLYDEPSGSKDADMGTVVSLMAGLGLPYLPYVNLSSRHGSAYTDQVKTIGAPLISFDRYPILKNDVADTGYFQNWSDVRAAALANGIPSWTYIQSVSFNGQGVPTKADLLWQINVSLAYGCDGIQYFTYWTPDPARGQAFHGGIITVDGVKTPLYEASKDVNHNWLAPVGTQLLRKPSQAVNAINLATPPAGLPALAADDPLIASTNGSAAYVGRFGSGSDSDPRCWLLVGNYSNTATATVGLVMADAVAQVETFDPGTGTYNTTSRNGRYVLDPGAAVLLRVSTTAPAPAPSGAHA